MSHYIEVTPAYGRDYKSAKAAQADWAADKDFVIQDFMSPWDGKPINRSQAVEAGYTVIRYGQLRKVCRAK